MARCCICGTSVSNDCESINIGFIKKKSFSVCDKCGKQLKLLSNKNLSEDDYVKVHEYIDKNDDKILNNEVRKYIQTIEQKRIKEQNKKPRKSRGKIFFVDKLPLGSFDELYGTHKYNVLIKIPHYCTCCMKETAETETVHAKCTEYGPGNVKRTRSMKLEFPLCEECRNTRTRPSVKITAFTIDFASFGLMFTNEEYAIKFSELNDKKYSSFEDDGFVSSMY